MHSHSANERGVRRDRPQTYGESPASGPAPTTAGHHKHDLLNKLDPRVDSTRDRQPMPAAGANIPEGTYGPHRSRAANALDPRVDSDLDSGRAGAGAGAGGGLSGGAAPAPGMMSAAASGAPPARSGGSIGGSHVPEAEGTYGPHPSRLANALDPRVDSDMDRHRRQGAAAGAQHHEQPGLGGGMDATNMLAGTGGAPAAVAVPAGGGSSTTSAGMGGAQGGVSAPHTAGPHKSDLLNKLDPRVDSKTGAFRGGPGEMRRGP